MRAAVFSVLSVLLATALASALLQAEPPDPKPEYAKAKPAFTWKGKTWPQGSRRGKKVDRVVIHSTFAKNIAKSKWFDRDEIFGVWRDYKVSPHYFIDRDGKVYQLVADAKKANHARGYNQRSIGIELAGIGGGFIREAKSKGATKADFAYTKKQYEALNGLVTDIKKRHEKAKAVLHSDIGGKEKDDPGPNFDRSKVTKKIEWAKEAKKKR